MDLLCIKSLEPYWGITYQKDKWYPISSILNRKCNLIIDNDNYWKYLKLVAQSKNYTTHFGYHKNVPQEEMYTVIDGYLTLSEIKDKYCKVIDLPFVVVVGDGGIMGKNEYCSLKRKDIIDTYKSDKFDTTVRFIEDNFITLTEYRENKLNILEI